MEKEIIDVYIGCYVTVETCKPDVGRVFLEVTQNKNTEEESIASIKLTCYQATRLRDYLTEFINKTE